MKKFEFLISESCATKFDIEAETEEQAKEIFEKEGLPSDIDSEFYMQLVESVEDIK